MSVYRDMSLAYTPEGFRTDFMRKAGMIGGAGPTLTQLICASSKFSVYESHTDAGVAYVYPVTFTEAELRTVVPDHQFSDAVRKHLVPMSKDEISQVVKSISQADTPSDIIAKLATNQMRLMIVTDSMLSSRGATEIIFGDHSLRLIFLKSIMRGDSVQQAEQNLVEAIQQVFGGAEAAAVQATGGNGDDNIEIESSPIYDLDGDGELIGGHSGGHHGKDFIELVFHDKGPRRPAVLLNESSLLDDIDDLGIAFADPLISTSILQYLGFLSIDDEMYVCPDSASLSSYIPKVGTIADPEKARRVLHVLVQSANRYGGAKLFRTVRTRLRDAGGLPSWIKMEISPRQEWSALSSRQLQSIREALLPKLEESTAQSIAMLNNPMPAGVFGVPLMQTAGSRWTFKNMADVWENLLCIRKKELGQINKKLSDNSWQKIVNKIQEYRDMETQLGTIEAVLAQYRATAIDTDFTEIDDIDTLTKLVDKQNVLEARKLKNVVRINDIFKTLFDTHRNTPPAFPRAV